MNGEGAVGAGPVGLRMRQCDKSDSGLTTMYWNARLGTSRFCSNADMNRRRGRSPALISGSETVKSSPMR